MPRFVAAAALALALAACSGGRSVHLSGEGTTTTTTPAPRPTTSTTGAPPATTSTTAVAPPRTTSTTAPPPPRTTVPSPTLPTYPAPAAVGGPSSTAACTASQLSAAAFADRRSYAASQTVNVVVVLTNRSPSACSIMTSSSRVGITDASGTVVYPTTGFGVCVNGVAVYESYVLQPGDSYDAATGQWDQRHHTCKDDNPGSRYPTGTYRANPEVYAQDGAVPAASTSFTLT